MPVRVYSARVLLAHLSLSALLIGAPMTAAPPGDRPDSSDIARNAVANGLAMPLPSILAIAHRHIPGDVLKVDLKDIAGRLDYEVRMLTPGGLLRAITLDARTGAILKIESN